MGCRILYDQESSEGCFYCSTTDRAFGPVMYADDQDKIEAFVAWLKVDPRQIPDDELCSKWYKFSNAFREGKCPDCETSLDEENRCPGCGEEPFPL